VRPIKSPSNHHVYWLNPIKSPYLLLKSPLDHHFAWLNPMKTRLCWAKSHEITTKITIQAGPYLCHIIHWSSCSASRQRPGPAARMAALHPIVPWLTIKWDFNNHAMMEYQDTMLI
jgi:hypothetical protein